MFKLGTDNGYVWTQVSGRLQPTDRHTQLRYFTANESLTEQVNE